MRNKRKEQQSLKENNQLSEIFDAEKSSIGKMLTGNMENVYVTWIDRSKDPMLASILSRHRARTNGKMDANVRLNLRNP